MSCPRKCHALWERVASVNDKAQRAGWESTQKGRRLMAKSTSLENRYNRECKECQGVSPWFIGGTLIAIGAFAYFTFPRS